MYMKKPVILLCMIDITAMGPKREMISFHEHNDVNEQNAAASFEGYGPPIKALMDDSDDREFVFDFAMPSDPDTHKEKFFSLKQYTSRPDFVRKILTECLYTQCKGFDKKSSVVKFFMDEARRRSLGCSVAGTLIIENTPNGPVGHMQFFDIDSIPIS